MIIGVTGTIGSGKGTFCSILEEIGYTKLAFGDEVREELKIRGIAENREALQRLGYELRDILVKKISSHFIAGRNYVIDGFRYPSQYMEMLSSHINSKLVAIDALEECRFDRLRKRKREGDPKNWEEFWVQNGRDWAGHLEGAGQDVRGCFKMADYYIDNNGTIENFSKKVKKFNEVTLLSQELITP